MSRRIFECLSEVMSRRDDLIVMNDDRADRDFPFVKRLTRFVKGVTHPSFMRLQDVLAGIDHAVTPES